MPYKPYLNVYALIMSIASVKPKPTMDADVNILWFLFLIDDIRVSNYMKSL